MSRLKRLIHEIHRRSLWQVLGIYVGRAWDTLRRVEALVSVSGLPEWVPGFAVVSNSKNVVCTAMLLDPVNATPTSMVMLPVFRMTKPSGM